MVGTLPVGCGNSMATNFAVLPCCIVYNHVTEMSAKYQACRHNFEDGCAAVFSRVLAEQPIPNLGVTGSNPVVDASKIKDLDANFSPQQILWVPYGFPLVCARKITSSSPLRRSAPTSLSRSGEAALAVMMASPIAFAVSV